MENIKIVVGIVTFNPDVVRLNENINALIKQIDNIVIIDNGSTNINEILLCTEPILNKIEIIKFHKNKGIATALKSIMEYAKEHKYEWVLTLDQDSVIEPGLVDEYLKASLDKRNQQVGMFTCLIKDRNFSDLKYENQENEYEDVLYCITSAAFTNVGKYFETSGYDPAFFIDCVDFDICYLLREKGYLIRRINFVGLRHEVGHGENRYFLWKRVVVYHQPPFRIYYLTRNTIWMHKKHRDLFSKISMVKKIVALAIRIILYEDMKKLKISSFIRGVKDSVGDGGYYINEN